VDRASPPDPAKAEGYPREVRDIVLWAGAPDKSAAGRSNAPWGTGATGELIVLAVIPPGLDLLAAVWRGGLSMMLAGIALVQADGRPAFRRQCALRAAIVWLPVGTLLFGSTLLQTYAPGQAYLAAGLWLVAAVLLPVYAVVALRHPSRPPQDRIAGTYLVPV
jgi:hypothetical protein